jgi:hypothetical protein
MLPCIGMQTCIRHGRVSDPVFRSIGAHRSHTPIPLSRGEKWNSTSVRDSRDEHCLVAVKRDDNICVYLR